MNFVQDEISKHESQAVAMEWRTPRSGRRLVGDTWRLFGGYPLVLLALTTAVVVPFEALSVATVGWNWDFHAGHADWAWVLFALNLVVVLPLILALQVDAAAAVRRGEGPRVLPIARRGLASLPLVAATLTERLGWRTAMKRGHGLSRGNYRHIALVLLLVVLIDLWIAVIFQTWVSGSASVLAHLLALFARIVILSFDALAIAVLYFDLVVRESPAVGPVAPSLMAPSPRKSPPVPLMGASGPAGAHPQDPRRYSDDERPPGWYVDPDSPNKMRFWMSLGKPPRWGKAEPTPRALRREWQQLQVE